MSQEKLFNKFSTSSDSEMRSDAQSIISGGRNLLVSVSVTMLPLLASRVDKGSRYIFCIVVATCIYERYMKLYFLIQLKNIIQPGQSSTQEIIYKNYDFYWT